ncbi:MAG: acyltransferase [Lactobacillus helsingborgensis]|nr:acyltransferase [Lactobacillus helsingborgensis]
MKKKHFVILGRCGLIYFSWVFIVLLLSLILLYESTKVFNWPALICALVFVMLLFYTYVYSYWNENILKLPFRTRIKKVAAPQIVLQWHCFKIYKIKVAEVGQYYLLRCEK